MHSATFVDRFSVCLATLLMLSLGSATAAQVARSGNPIIQGWYADPGASM